jgi:uncharacterized protein YutE (UPF0331/DUF86 family)
MAADPVLLRKAQIIERCILRIREEMAGAPSIESISQTKQDSVLLNLERSCQACIDLAMRIVRIKRLGIPTESREAFSLVKKAGLMSDGLYKEMLAMVGFRNTAVHDYQGLNLKIIDGIVRDHLEHFLEFASLGIRMI